MNKILPSLVRNSLPPLNNRSGSFFRSCLLLILIGVLLASCTAFQKKYPKAVVQAAFDRLNQGDAEGFLKYFAGDAVMVDPGGLLINGKTSIREKVTQELINLKFELSDFKVNGNQVTYAVKTYHYNIEVGSYSDSLDVVVNGRIIFDGTVATLAHYCGIDPSQAYCK